VAALLAEQDTDERVAPSLIGRPSGGVVPAARAGSRWRVGKPRSIGSAGALRVSELGEFVQVATGYVGQVSLSPDGRSYAVASGDGTASVWDVRSSTRVGNPFPAPDAIPAVLFEPNGRLLIEEEADDPLKAPTAARTHEKISLLSTSPTTATGSSPEPRRA
jgi:WD40 repeat protein